MRTVYENSLDRCPLFETLEPRQLLAVIFQDGFEGGGVGWVVNVSQGVEWELNAYKAHDGALSIFSSGTGGDPNIITMDNQYVAGQNNFIRTNVDLANYTDVTLGFWYWNRTNVSDGFTVTVNGTQEFHFAGDSAGWQHQVLDLSAFAGMAGVAIEFDFTSSSALPADSGTWIDDILMQGTPIPGKGPLPFLNHIPKVTAPAQNVNPVVWFYDNDNLVVAASIIGNDNVLTITGPNGFFQQATYTNIDPAADGPAIMATYHVTPPNAVNWTSADNGVYTVHVNGGTVVNEAGDANGDGVLGFFTVAINNAPDVDVLTPAGPKAGNIPITYTLFDDESNKCSILVEYSADGGATWHTATKGAGGQGKTGLTSSPAGIAHTFVWNSRADLGSVVDATVKFRITPKDAKGTGPSDTTLNFTVDNFNRDFGPSVVTPAAAGANPVTGTTVALSVLGAENWNTWGEGILKYTWSTTGASPAGVTFNAANGTNAGKNVIATFARIGTYDFLVTITDTQGLSTTSTVSVTVNPTLTSITVNPANVHVQSSLTQQFTAQAKDQFGHLLAVQPAIVWSKAAGVGSIDAFGLYTAPAGVGVATVRATSGAVHGDGAVTVQATPVAANSAALTIAGAGTYQLYVNGTLIGTGSGVKLANLFSEVALNPGQNVIAIRDVSPRGSAGLIADVIINGVRTGSTSAAWKVSTTSTDGWNNIGYDDSLWSAATEYGGPGTAPLKRSPSGLPSATDARWIWTNRLTADHTAFFRYSFVL
jgi:hypothetical protein